MSVAARSSPDAVAQRVLALTTERPRAALALARRTLARGIADPGARALMWRALGHAQRAVGDYRGARVSYRRARRMFDRLGRTFDHALCALGLIDACMYLGRADEALDAAAGARRVFGGRRDLVRLARLETNVGNLHHHLDRLEQSLVCYDRASRLFERVGSPLDRARVDHNRANLLTHLGRRREAEHLYLSSRRAFTRAGERVLAAQVSYGIACLRFLNGEYAAAMLELENVRPRLERAGARPLLALADVDLAEILLAIRLHPEALALATAARRWFHAHGVPASRARCDLVIGLAQVRLGRAAQARRALSAAGRVFRAQRHRSGEAAVRLARAQLLVRAGRPLPAASEALLAMKGFRAAGFPNRALAAGAQAAEALLEAPRHGRARDLARRLRREPPSPGDAFSRARLARVEAAAADRQGDGRTALRLYRTALDETGRSHAALLLDEWRVGYLEDEPPLLDEALGVVLRRSRRPRPRDVWDWLARAHAHARWTGAGDVPKRNDAVLARAARLRRELESCYARLWRPLGAARHARPRAVRSLERRTLRIEGALRRLGGTDAARAARLAVEPPAPAAGTTHVHYFSADGRLGALRHDTRGWTLHADLASLDQLDRSVRLLHFLIDQLSVGAAGLAPHQPAIVARVEEHLAAIARLVLDPVLDGATPDRAVFAPSAALWRVPFHALPHRGKPLAIGSEVVVDAWTARAATQPRRSGAVVLAWGGDGFPGAEREAADIAALLRKGGVPVECHRGARATRDRLRDTAATAGVVHLSGHAIYRAEHPEFSAVRLADGWLNARDFAALPLAGAVVVLSACETGPRGAVAGAEYLGLVRGLLRAGARAVVSTLWRVDDEAARRFTLRLYGAWSRGVTLARALQEAQTHAVAQRQPPHDWAPYCLLGDGEARWPAARRTIDHDAATPGRWTHAR